MYSNPLHHTVRAWSITEKNKNKKNSYESVLSVKVEELGKMSVRRSWLSICDDTLIKYAEMQLLHNSARGRNCEEALFLKPVVFITMQGWKRANFNNM